MIMIKIKVSLYSLRFRHFLCSNRAQVWGKYFTRLTELITSLNIQQRLLWDERAAWANWSWAWASVCWGRERWLTWSTGWCCTAKSNMWMDVQPAEDTHGALRIAEERPRKATGGLHARTSSGNSLGPCRALFRWDLLSALKSAWSQIWVCLSTQGCHPWHPATVTWKEAGWGGGRGFFFLFKAVSCICSAAGDIPGCYLINWAESFLKKR